LFASGAQAQTNLTLPDWGLGAAITLNASGKRVEDVSVNKLADDTVEVKFNKEDQDDLRWIGEVHHTTATTAISLPKLGMCGPFVLLKQECGPFFALAGDDKGLQEGGLGWMVKFGKLGLGVGMLFDPETKQLDSAIVDPVTRKVRPEYETWCSTARPA
jgi:hypothetical protein